MRRCAAIVGTAICAWPMLSVHAESVTARSDSTPVPINFNILPGSQVQGQPVKRSFDFTVAPGQSLDNTLAVVNPSRTEALTVRFNVADVVTPPQGGGMAYDDSGRMLGRWLRLSVSRVTVQPYHITFVPVTLSVPNSTTPGEFEGAIGATNVQPETVTSGKYKFSLYLNRRCLVLVRVAGAATAGLRVTWVGIKHVGGRTLVAFQVRNTGTLIDYPLSTFATFAGATRVYSLAFRFGMLVANAVTTLVYDISRAVPDGNYQLRIRINYVARTRIDAPLQNLVTEWTGWLGVPSGAGR